MKSIKFLLLLSLVIVAIAAIQSSSHESRKLRKLRKHKHQTKGDQVAIFDAGSSGTRRYLVSVDKVLNADLNQIKADDELKCDNFRLSDVFSGKLIQCPQAGSDPLTDDDNSNALKKAAYYGKCLGLMITVPVKKIIIEATAGARQSLQKLDTQYTGDQVINAIKAAILVKCTVNCANVQPSVTVLSGRFEGMYGYLSSYIGAQQADSKAQDDLKGDNFRKNAVYMEVGGASIQFAFAVDASSEQCINTVHTNYENCVNPKPVTPVTKKHRFHRKNKQNKGYIEIADFISGVSTNNKLQLYSKSFLGNANNELVNRLVEAGVYQYCSYYKYQVETDSSKAAQPKQALFDKLTKKNGVVIPVLADVQIAAVSKNNIPKIDPANGDILYEVSSSNQNLGNFNNDYNWDKCYNLVTNIRSLVDTTKEEQLFNCQWTQMQEALNCGKMNEDTKNFQGQEKDKPAPKTLVINNGGLSSLVAKSGTSNFANTQAYNLAIQQICQRSDKNKVHFQVPDDVAKKIPLKFMSVACVYSMYSLMTQSRFLNGWHGKVLVQSKDWFLGSLFYQLKKNGAVSDPWVNDQTNAKENAKYPPARLSRRRNRQLKHRLK